MEKPVALTLAQRSFEDLLLVADPSNVSDCCIAALRHLDGPLGGLWRSQTFGPKGSYPSMSAPRAEGVVAAHSSAYGLPVFGIAAHLLSECRAAGLAGRPQSGQTSLMVCSQFAHCWALHIFMHISGTCMLQSAGGRSQKRTQWQGTLIWGARQGQTNYLTKAIDSTDCKSIDSADAIKCLRRHIEAYRGKVSFSLPSGWERPPCTVAIRVLPQLEMLKAMAEM